MTIMTTSPDSSRVYLLRSCASDFTASFGFRWPNEVGAECRPESWRPDEEPDHVPLDGVHCLYGFPCGEGDAAFAHWADDAQWLVFSAPSAEVVVGREVSKAASARIEHVGVGATGVDRLQSCLGYLASIGRLGPRAVGLVRHGGHDCIFSGGDRAILTGGDRANLTGGDRSVLVGGQYSSLTGGDHSRLTAGQHSVLTAGNHSTLAGGDSSRITGGERSVLAGDDGATLTGGYGSRLVGGRYSVLTGGDYCVLAGGDRSCLTGGDYCRLTGGDRSSLTGGDRSCLTAGAGSYLRAGHDSVLTGGDGATLAGGCRCTLVGGHDSHLTGGPGSVLIFRWRDGCGDWHVTTAVVGADAQPGIAYTVTSRGRIVPAAT